MSPRMNRMDIRRFALALLPLALTACAATSPPASVPVAAPDSWQAAADQPKPPGTDLTAPHGGSAAQLKAWWQQWNDPLLIELLDRAQQASPSVAAAATRVAQARQAVVVAGAAGSPSLNANAGVSRGVSMLNTPPATSANVGLQAAWESSCQHGAVNSSTARGVHRPAEPAELQQREW